MESTFLVFFSNQECFFPNEKEKNNPLFFNILYAISIQFFTNPGLWVIHALSITKSKNSFTKIINSYKQQYSFNLQELFVDSTFGFNDSRGKLIESIIKSYKSDEPLKIEFPDKYIGLINVVDLVNYILENIERNASSKVVISSKYLYEIGSINEFVKSNNKISSIKKRINSKKFKEPSLEVVKLDSKLENFINIELGR